MHLPRFIFRIPAFTLLFFFMVMVCYAEQSSPGSQAELTQKQQNQKLFLVTMAGVGVITAWGVAQWDYFSQSPHAISEGWFSNDTKYLFALKLNGFKNMQNSMLKHIELLLGYYTRGFSDAEEAKQRNIFVGVGLNLTDFFRRHSYNKTATILRYIQIPYIYIEYANDLNE